MSRYNNFMAEWDNTYVFFDINIDDVPSISFNFGTADVMAMDFEKLGKIIAIIKWKTIPIWAMAKDNDKHYRTKITNNIKVTHFILDGFFKEEKEIDFKKYDCLTSNYDFKYQNVIAEW